MAGIDNIGPMLATFSIRAVAAGAPRFELRLAGQNDLCIVGRPLGCDGGNERKKSGYAASFHVHGPPEELHAHPPIRGSRAVVTCSNRLLLKFPVGLLNLGVVNEGNFLAYSKEVEGPITPCASQGQNLLLKALVKAIGDSIRSQRHAESIERRPIFRVEKRKQRLRQQWPQGLLLRGSDSTPTFLVTSEGRYRTDELPIVVRSLSSRFRRVLEKDHLRVVRETPAQSTGDDH